MKTKKRRQWLDLTRMGRPTAALFQVNGFFTVWWQRLRSTRKKSPEKAKESGDPSIITRGEKCTDSSLAEGSGAVRTGRIAEPGFRSPALQ